MPRGIPCEAQYWFLWVCTCNFCIVLAAHDDGANSVVAGPTGGIGVDHRRRHQRGGDGGQETLRASEILSAPCPDDIQVGT